MGGLRRLVFRTIYERARQFRLFREQISSLYTSSYGMFRDYFLELGRRLVARGVLDCANDVFYLSREEVENAIWGADMNWRETAKRRRTEVEASQGIILPPVIYGNEPPPILPSGNDIFYGTPTSRGYYAGPICVVKGIEDFQKVQDGDVLVVPFSDVSWTPLFARAGAVVAESGGMLSHSSIIAREYNIPAVVSVEGATRLADGLRVAVDGYRGYVTIIPEG
jgi:pyruvate,water dikinase